jgi:hypothetical protein
MTPIVFEEVALPVLLGSFGTVMLLAMYQAWERRRGR